MLLFSQNNLDKIKLKTGIDKHRFGHLEVSDGRSPHRRFTAHYVGLSGMRCNIGEYAAEGRTAEVFKSLRRQ